MPELAAGARVGRPDVIGEVKYRMPLTSSGVDLIVIGAAPAVNRVAHASDSAWTLVELICFSSLKRRPE